MAEVGFARTQEILAAAERSGGADRNPYAATIYRDFVQPLAALVQQAQAVKGPASNAAHIVLLRPLDPWAVAFIAVRVALNSILAPMDKEGATVRKMAFAIGKAVHSELYLAQFKELAPDLFFIISEDLTRRKGKSSDHRVETFKAQARAKGMVFLEWGVGNRDQIGAWLMEQLSRLGMLVMDLPKPGPGKRNALHVHLTADVHNAINQIKTHFALSRPFYGPCVEPPLDWTAWDQGGWHTPAMRRVLPYPVKARATVREKLQHMEMPVVWKCLNTLQRTPWKVNREVLRVVDTVSRSRNIGELVMAPPEDKPTAPEWFETVGDGERTPEQEKEFADWKAAMTGWYTTTKLQRTARQRFGTSLRTAREYEEYPEFFFVHFCDSRGRVYPMSQGITPQGSDVQKALIHFARGEPVTDPAALAWFFIHGANKWGFDKAPLQERADWHKDKIDLILAMADDPESNQDWLKADNPCQFLAWVLEFRQWYLNPRGFLSHLPISLDGSCSGLQHFSAMLRDPVGGKATNLIPNPVMQDIYKMVAEATTVRLQQAEPDAEGYRQRWLDHGINRSLTKRSVMTTPYGVTKNSALRYVIEDYLRPNGFIPPREQYKAAAYLMNYVWPAIGDVVVKGREAMSWLEAGAKQIIKAGKAKEGDITWVTPSGFLASQAYYETEEHNVRTLLFGHAKIKCVAESTTPSKDRHSNGMAPNFVHSMDASHLHLTTVRAEDEVPGISLAMIHDDFGTHAAHTPMLYHALRDEFVKMYEGNEPLDELAAKYNLPPPPEKGSLDLSGVRDSEFVFS